MMTNYKISEVGKDDTGLVGHSVVTITNRLAEFVSYDDARNLVEKQLKTGDMVTEVYLGGRSVKISDVEFLAQQTYTRQKYGI